MAEELPDCYCCGQTAAIDNRITIGKCFCQYLCDACFQDMKAVMNAVVWLLVRAKTKTSVCPICNEDEAKPFVFLLCQQCEAILRHGEKIWGQQEMADLNQETLDAKKQAVSE